MAERFILQWLRPGPALRAIWAAREAEEADRAAWLVGIQKRLGLITMDNLLELEIIKDRRLLNSMPELPGQMTIYDALKDELDGEPTASRAVKILDDAAELGWTENPSARLVIRLTREDGVPFFAAWDLSANPETGKRSWRFAGARAKNMQPLAYRDIKPYLEDPRVILPEMPDEMCEAAEHEDPDQTMAGALEALSPLNPSLAPEWGVLRG